MTCYDIVINTILGLIRLVHVLRNDTVINSPKQLFGSFGSVALKTQCHTLGWTAYKWVVGVGWRLFIYFKGWFCGPSKSLVCMQQVEMFFVYLYFISRFFLSARWKSADPKMKQSYLHAISAYIIRLLSTFDELHSIKACCMWLPIQWQPLELSRKGDEYEEMFWAELYPLTRLKIMDIKLIRLTVVLSLMNGLNRKWSARGLPTYVSNTEII